MSRHGRVLRTYRPCAKNPAFWDGYENGMADCAHHRLVLRGKDYEYDGTSGGTLSNFKNELTSSVPAQRSARPAAIFNGTTILHFGGSKAAYRLLPIIPPKKQAAGKKRRK